MEYQIIADESVDYRIVLELRIAGFNVYSVAEEQPSIKDEEVLTFAHQNKALLITEDKDFGELAFLLQLPHSGILLIRIEDKSMKLNEAVSSIVNHFDQMLNRFSVINKGKLRIRD